jgi:hypothetical protein
MTLIFSLDCQQNASAIWSASFPGEVSAITLTLIDCRSGSVINDREEQNVLNANGCTWSDGVFVWEMEVSDNLIVSETTRVGRREIHRASFLVTHSTGTYRPQVEIGVLRLRAFDVGPIS